MATVSKKKGKMAEINIVPLVDVVLVLLIIFMVITPLLIKELNAEVPEKAEVEVEQVPTDQLVLSMQADRTLYINKEPVASEDLQEKLGRIFKARERKSRIIFFDAADDVNYSDAIAVMDVVRGSGAEKIGIVEEHKDPLDDGADPAADPAAAP